MLLLGAAFRGFLELDLADIELHESLLILLLESVVSKSEVSET